MVIESPEKYMEHTRSGKTEDLTAGGKCSQCGECCAGILPLSEKEKQRIHRYIKAHGIKEQKLLVPTATPVMDMTCPFLDKQKMKEKCRIYPVRPAVCRAYLCSMSRDEIITEGNLLAEERERTSMREEFFGSGSHIINHRKGV